MSKILKLVLLSALCLVLMGILVPQNKISAQADPRAGGHTLGWSFSCTGFTANGITSTALLNGHPDQLGIAVYALSGPNWISLVPTFLYGSGVGFFHPTHTLNYFNEQQRPGASYNWIVAIDYNAFLRAPISGPTTQRVTLWNTSGGFHQDFFVTCDSNGNQVGNAWTNVLISS